jgi:alpha-tubulin suppressor-like RCC1 family protein
MNLNRIIIASLVLLAACGGRIDTDTPTIGTVTSGITPEPGQIAGISAGQYFANVLRPSFSPGGESSASYSVGSEKSGELGNSVDSASGTATNPVLNWQLPQTLLCNAAQNSALCIVATASGTCHTLWLMATGQIYGMGCNGQGQLGIPGDLSDKDQPTPLPTGNVVAIGAGGNSSYAATNPAAYNQTGSPGFYATGQNDHGQLGINSFTNANGWSPVSFSSSGLGVSWPIVKIASGGQHVLVMDSQNQVYAWGRNDKAQVESLPGQADQSRPQGLFSGACTVNAGGGHDYIAAGAETSYWAGYRVSGGICQDVEVLSWGGNSQGELGIGTSDTGVHPLSFSSPSLHINAVVGNIYLGIVAGPYSAYALYGQNWTGSGVQGDKKAHLYVTGANGSGQLGTGNQSNVSAWTIITNNFGPDTDSYVMAAGFDAAYVGDATANNPLLLVTGGDSDGQLALGGFSPSSLWTPSEL